MPPRLPQFPPNPNACAVVGYMQTDRPFAVVGTESEALRCAEALKGLPVYDADADAANVALVASTRREGKAGAAILILGGEKRGEWAEALTEAGHPYVIADSRAYADALSKWPESKEELRSMLIADCDRAKEDEAEIRQAMDAERLARLHVHDTMDVAMEIYGKAVHSEPIPTGLRNLDEAIGGGLPQGGLTVLGAGSSNGKTTMALQIGDSLASGFHVPVLFVSIEQSRHELVAKSLSRLMRQTKKRNGGYYVASASNILSTRERASWPQDKEAALLSCCTWYSQEIAPNMHIMEMTGQPTVEDIVKAYEALEKHYEQFRSHQRDLQVHEFNEDSELVYQTSRKPILIIDYLQLVAAKDEHMSERKAVDVNVMALRQLARDKKTAVLVISSINRQSYSEGADMSAFKESGSIEFSSDLALMLQPRDFSKKVGKAKSDKQAREEARDALTEHKGKAVRQSEIVVLKNRGGKMPAKPIPILFDALCNTFTEDTERASDSEKKQVL